MPSRNELIAYNRDINQIENNLFIDKMIYQEGSYSGYYAKF